MLNLSNKKNNDHNMIPNVEQSPWLLI